MELNNVDMQLIEEFGKLPIDFWDFTNQDTKELTHGIHNYPAIMVYPISRNIIRIVKKYQNIENVLDPFMGSGTVLLEALLAGAKYIYGNDLNPLAYKISKAKTTVITSDLMKTRDELLSHMEYQYEKYKDVIDNVGDYVEQLGYDITAKVNEKDNWGARAPQILNEYLSENNKELIIPEIKNMGFWFVPRCVIELELIKREIDKIEDANSREYFLLAFSETTRLVSNRRNGEFKMYRMQAEKVKKYNPNVKDTYLKTLDANINKMRELAERVKNYRHTVVSLSLDDASKLSAVPDDSIDLVVTSPPYGDSRTTVAYGQFSRVSLQWCDYEQLSYKDIIDIDKNLMGGTAYKKGFSYDLRSETLKNALAIMMEDESNLERAGDVYSFYKDMEKILETVSKKCKKNSYQFWVVGNRTVKNIQLPTDKILIEFGKEIGLKYVTTLGRTISNKVMPSENSPTNEAGKKVKTMNEELIVVFRKES